jgi:RES domain-containing protein
MYFADSEATACGEWYRALAEFAIPPERQMPRDLWRWRLVVEGVADLSTEDALRSVGLTMPSPTQSEWPMFQDVGERLWREGYSGVLAPSASRPTHLGLCLFRDAEQIAARSRSGR